MSSRRRRVETESSVKLSEDSSGYLRTERQRLLDERSELRAKIARLRVQAKRAARSSEQNHTFITRLDREYRTMEQQIMRSRAQIKELLMSDRAARRLELEEEAKVLYQERLRLEDIQERQQNEAEEAREEYARLMSGRVETSQAEIEDLEAKLARVRKANARLTQQIRELKERREADEAIGDVGTTSRAERMRLQIRSIEQETEEIEEKMRKAEEKHEMVMRSLRSQLQRTIEEGSQAAIETGEAVLVEEY